VTTKIFYFSFLSCLTTTIVFSPLRLSEIIWLRFIAVPKITYSVFLGCINSLCINSSWPCLHFRATPLVPCPLCFPAKPYLPFIAYCSRMGITTVFVDTRLWKTKHSRKCFQNFRQSYVLLTDRIEIHQSEPVAWPSDLLYVMLAGCDWWISIWLVDNT